MTRAALRVENLACERGGRMLFRDLSFTVERGSGLVLTGPNGVGKTSLLRVLGGLLRPSVGRIVLQGGDPEAGLAEQSHLIGLREALKPSLTVTDHLRFWRALLGGETWREGETWPEGETWREERKVVAPSGPTDRETAFLANLLLRQQAHSPVAYLSSGQRHRLALGRLFCAERSIWLLDEPFNALDAESRDHFRRVFTRFLDRGGILIAATHDPLQLASTRILRLRRDMAGIEPELVA